MSEVEKAKSALSNYKYGSVDEHEADLIESLIRAVVKEELEKITTSTYVGLHSNPVTIQFKPITDPDLRCQHNFGISNCTLNANRYCEACHKYIDE